jgi:hypothetical protein
VGAVRCTRSSKRLLPAKAPRKEEGPSSSHQPQGSSGGDGQQEGQRDKHVVDDSLQRLADVRIVVAALRVTLAKVRSGGRLRGGQGENVQVSPRLVNSGFGVE